MATQKQEMAGVSPAGALWEGARQQNALPIRIIAHFDGHGVATAAARARTLGLSVENIMVKFPDTGPEKFADFVETFWSSLIGRRVEIIDIPVNLKNPARHIEVLERLGQNAEVHVYDHHETDLQYFATLRYARVAYFNSGVAMAKALAVADELRLAYIGVVADRDASLTQELTQQEIERELVPYANTLDVLVRQDVQTTTRELVAHGIEYLARASQQVQYPPYRLADSVRVVRRGYNAILTEVDGQQVQQWLWKTLETIAMRHNVDYVIAITSALDRQTNQLVPIVAVIRYWLSQRPTPRRIVENIIAGRMVIGHPDAFSVRAMDVDDAKRIAEQMFQVLDGQTSRVSHLINESHVAEAIRSDYTNIMSRLTQILETMNKMYEEYLELKRRQVELLERATQQQRTRYD